MKKGGSVADFVAATAQARMKNTPGAGKLAGKPDEVKCLSTESASAG